MAWDVGSRTVFVHGEKITHGYLLREAKNGVVLEKYYDDARVDVVAEFEGTRINNEFNYLRCLDAARDYVENSKIPIHVDLTPWESQNNQ